MTTAPNPVRIPVQCSAVLRRCIAGQGIRWYYAVALALLLLAAVLRFYDLSGSPLGGREAERFYLVMQGDSPSEFLSSIRGGATHPVGNYLLLRAVQEVDVSLFSIRVVPVVASLLTVAVILFLLPRVGVDRRVALMAGLLATLSVGALHLARVGRGYPLDALAAVLIIAGLLLYLRTGRKILFCVTLFLAPLVDYGSAIFSIAALATAFTAARPSTNPWHPEPGNRYWYAARLRHWLKQRKDLVWPGACWLAGSAATGFLTLAYQWQRGHPAGNDGRFYFDGDFFLTAALPFAVARLWELLTWLLPSLVAALAVGAFGVLLLYSLSRRRFHPLLTLTLLALGVSVVLAWLRFYPVGPTRHMLYLGPLLFLAAGFAFCGVADRLASYARREWLAPAVLAGLALLSALAGTAAIRESDIYGVREDSVADFYLALKARILADDVVYVTGSTFLTGFFHTWGKPASYRFWSCRSDFKSGCMQETISLALRDQPVAQRIWFVSEGGSPDFEKQTLRAWEQQGLVERIPIDRGRIAWLMRDTGWLREKQAVFQAAHQDITAGEPAARSDFDLYLHDNDLYYNKEPCITSSILTWRLPDDAGSFFLNLIPLDVADLPPAHRSSGRQGLSFIFMQRGTVVDGSCFAKVPLPDYDFPLAEIRAGQYVDAGGPLWAAVIDRKPDYFRSVYPAITAAAPAARGVFDLYLTDDALYYYREPCRPADTARRFFLHLSPADAADLPAEGQQRGFDNRDFAFDRYGAAFDGKCMAKVRRPDYPIAAIKTGQFVIGEPPAWSVELTVEP